MATDVLIDSSSIAPAPRYAELMGSSIGNTLGLTVNEVFWAAERRRQGLGDLATKVHEIGFPDASKWTHEDIESRRSILDGLAELHDTVGWHDVDHPWWGFHPNLLAPGDDERIAGTIHRALEHARNAHSAVEGLVEFFGYSEQPDVTAIGNVRATLDRVRPFSDRVDPALLARMFDSKSDPVGLRSSRLLKDVETAVTLARRLYASASTVFFACERPTKQAICDARKLVETRKVSPALLTGGIELALDSTKRLASALERFEVAAQAATPPHRLPSKSSTDAFLSNCARPQASGLLPFSARSIKVRADTVPKAANSLSDAVARGRDHAGRLELPFDATPNSVLRLANLDGVPGLTAGTQVDPAALGEGRRLATLPLAHKSIAEIRRLKIGP